MRGGARTLSARGIRVRFHHSHRSFSGLYTFTGLQHRSISLVKEHSGTMPDRQTYSETHDHPSHIDIPQGDVPAAPGVEDQLSPFPGPSGNRPAPSRGILKNPLRRPSLLGDGEISPATDAQRAAAEQYVLDHEPRGRGADKRAVCNGMRRTLQRLRSRRILSCESEESFPNRSAQLQLPSKMAAGRRS